MRTITILLKKKKRKEKKQWAEFAFKFPQIWYETMKPAERADRYILIWKQTNKTFSYENKQTKKAWDKPNAKIRLNSHFCFPLWSRKEDLSSAGVLIQKDHYRLNLGLLSRVWLHMIVQKVTQLLVFWTKLWEEIFFYPNRNILGPETQSGSLAVFITPQCHREDTIALERQRAVYYCGAIVSRDHYWLEKCCPEDLWDQSNDILSFHYVR